MNIADYAMSQTVVGQKPYRSFEIGDFQKFMPTKTGFNINKFLDFSYMYPTWDKMGKMKPGEIARNTSWASMFPFLGTAETAINAFKFIDAVKRLDEDNYSMLDKGLRAKDSQLVMKHMLKMAEVQYRGVDIPGQATEGVLNLPAFIMEFVLGGKLASMVTKKAFGKSMDMVAKGLTKKIATAKMSEMATVALMGTGNEFLRTMMMPTRIADSALQREMRSMIQLTDKGYQVSTQSMIEPWKAWMQGISDIWIENISESSGEAFNIAGGQIGRRLYGRLPASARNAIANTVSDLIPKEVTDMFIQAWGVLKPNDDIAKLFTISGYNGLLQEMGEERLGSLMRAITGIEDFGASNPESWLDRVISSIPSGEQLAVEAMIFSVPMGGQAALGMARKYDLRKLNEAAVDTALKTGPEFLQEANKATKEDVKKYNNRGRPKKTRQQLAEEGRISSILRRDGKVTINKEILDNFTPEEQRKLKKAASRGPGEATVDFNSWASKLKSIHPILSGKTDVEIAQMIIAQENGFAQSVQDVESDLARQWSESEEANEEALNQVEKEVENENWTEDQLRSINWDEETESELEAARQEADTGEEAIGDDGSKSRLWTDRPEVKSKTITSSVKKEIRNMTPEQRQDVLDNPAVGKEVKEYIRGLEGTITEEDTEKAVPGLKEKKQEKKTSRKQAKKPVEGEGRKRVSKLVQRAKAEPGLRTALEGKGEYRQKDWEKLIEDTANYIVENYDDALAIATGQKTAPQGMYAGMFYKLMSLEASARGDVLAVYNLAMSPMAEFAIEAGREVKAFDVPGILADPVAAIQDIRKELQKLKDVSEKEVNKQVDELKQEVKKEQKKDSQKKLNDFLDGLVC